MFILGTLKQWKTIYLDEAKTKSIRLLLESIPDDRRKEILANIAHLKPVPTPETEKAPDDQVASDADQKWFEELAVGFGLAAVKNWEGLGSSVGEDGKVQAVPCTPESVEIMMRDARFMLPVVTAINQVNERFVEEVKDAGNA